jgi:hypothetical protein
MVVDDGVVVDGVVVVVFDGGPPVQRIKWEMSFPTERTVPAFTL